MEPDLVFDVGVNNGEDTAHYLRRGFRVVGVDANPEMVAFCERRFEDDIRTRRLHPFQAHRPVDLSTGRAAASALRWTGYRDAGPLGQGATAAGSGSGSGGSRFPSRTNGHTGYACVLHELGADGRRDRRTL